VTYLEVALFVFLVSMVCASLMEAAGAEKKRVVVRADESEGPANLEFLLGVCMCGPEHNTSHPWHKAWKSIGLKHVRGPSLDFAPKITTEGGSASDLEFDFSALDESMRVFREMGAENLLTFSGTPQYLSSNPDAEKMNEGHFSQYAPRDHALWERHVAAAVRHMVEKWNCRGACYEVWNEPEDFEYYWKGTPGSADTLLDYVTLYVHTAKAVKRADPTAKIGGPATAHWDSATGGAHAWGLPQFLRAFTKYRETHPAENIPLDFIIWHDYTWISHCPSLLDGVAFVDKTLDELGWKERPEYWITEWNLAFGEWAEKHSLLEFSSHIAANILEQANARSRRLSRMYFYVFDYDDNPKTPLISGWARAQPGKSAEQSGEIQLQPSAAVFQMVNELNHGELVPCEASLPLTAAATQEGERLRVMMNNYSPEPCKTELVLEGIGKTDGALQCHVQRVDEERSSDGKGLERGESRQLGTIGGSATLPLDMSGFSTVLVVLHKAAG